MRKKIMAFKPFNIESAYSEMILKSPQKALNLRLAKAIRGKERTVSHFFSACSYFLYLACIRPVLDEEAGKDPTPIQIKCDYCLVSFLCSLSRYVPAIARGSLQNTC